MYFHLFDGSAVFGVSIPITNFAALRAAHRAVYPTTPAIEAQGASLLEADFPAGDASEFVRAVCIWGGYAGIAGRILRRNTAEEIANALRDSARLLNLGQPDFIGAMSALNELNDLGSPSFSSKHLRFLRPDLCPAFDSLLKKALPYKFDAHGFAEFAIDCGILAQTLSRDARSLLPDRPDGKWYAADVEAAVYACVAELVMD